MLTDKNFKKVWEKLAISATTPLFLGISGGVDSMVLLALLQKNVPNPLTLLHVNYGLRKEAATETAFLKKLAQTQHLPFRVAYYKGEAEKFTEEKGRIFRYDFFKSHLPQQGILLTAHQKDDVAETLLMKMTRGTALNKLGFLQRQAFAKGQLVRPLLDFTKKEIYAYGKAYQLTYFEDQSNEDLRYTRNRYRHEILPLLKKENPQLVSHLGHLNEELNSLRTETRIPEGPFSLEAFRKLPLFLQGDYLKGSLQEADILIQPGEISQMVRQLQAGKKELLFSGGQLSVTEDFTLLLVEKDNSDFEPDFCHDLPLNQWVNLSSHEKLGLFSPEFPVVFPESGQADFLPLYEKPVFPLEIRHPQSGDRLSLKKEGYHKKLRRYLIDEKVPLEKREKQWVVADKFKNILWVVPIGKSYLSYNNETAKILYRLIYFKK